MLSNLDDIIKDLATKKNRCHLSNYAEEKLSGGFFSGTELFQSTTKLVHPYFAFVYLIRGTGVYGKNRTMT